MNIIIKHIEDYSPDELEEVTIELNKLQDELIAQVKESLSMLTDLDSLYELRDYIDSLIDNFEDIEVDLKED